MSALTPKADIDQKRMHTRYVPIENIPSTLLLALTIRHYSIG
jgi:hypothetical protein